MNNQCVACFLCYHSDDTPCLYYNDKTCGDNGFCYNKIAQVNRMVSTIKTVSDVGNN